MKETRKASGKRSETIRLSLHTRRVTHQADAYLRFQQHEATRSSSTPSWMGC